jgi:hypothetical protein
MAISIQRTASQILEGTKVRSMHMYWLTVLRKMQREALQQLRPSQYASFGSIVADQAIRREGCTPNTRVKILDEIKIWMRDSSPNCPLVFWLTGQAGSGKTTIATTIAGFFDRDCTSEEGVILGASFFCSRQSPETRNSIRVVPTIAYQLARKCDPFAEALIVSNKFDTVSICGNETASFTDIQPLASIQRHSGQQQANIPHCH